MLVRKWADEKKENRRGWCQALHTVVSAGRSRGSLLWHTFPQEAIDMIAEETGSQPVRLAAPSLVDGEIEFDAEGRVFLVERGSPMTQLPQRGGESVFLPAFVLLKLCPAYYRTYIRAPLGAITLD
jgi:hypothetical protein